jgi:hypothetical protein
MHNDKADEPQEKRRPYQAPAVESDAAFERAALACNSDNADSEAATKPPGTACGTVVS